MLSREVKPALHRPQICQMVSLTEVELLMLFKHRADIIHAKLKNNAGISGPSLYWSELATLQNALYETMLEIQSRYPVGSLPTEIRLLPIREPLGASVTVDAPWCLCGKRIEQPARVYCAFCGGRLKADLPRG